jgi:preprotein translocase subunit YajC
MMNYLNGVILSGIELIPGEADPSITGGQQTTTQTQTQTEVGGDAAGLSAGDDAPAEAGLAALLPSLLMPVLIFAMAYFLLIRPQRKQAKEVKVMQGNIRPGDNIVTQSGLYGKVMDIGEDVFVVEFGTNRGIRIPVAKSEIAAIKLPKLTPPPAPPKE